MKTYATRFAAVTAFVVLGGCADNRPSSDAYGNFEATEILVSAEVGGRIVEILRLEGEQVKQGEVLVRLNDSTPHAQLVLARTPAHRELMNERGLLRA